MARLYNSHQSITPKSVAFFLGFTLLGLLGNYLRVPIFGGIEFLFGTIAILVIVSLYGTVWGVAAALVISSYTYVLLGHPYLMIIYVCEALFVDIFLLRRDENMILTDGLFWIFIGIPMVWLFYYVVLKLNPDTTLLIILKQAVNGIFNALVASIIITHLPLKRWVFGITEVENIALRKVVFNLLVASLLLPALIVMFISGRNELRSMETNAKSLVKHESTQVTSLLEVWQKQHLHAVSQLAQIASKAGVVNSIELQKNVENITKSFPDFVTMLVCDEKGISVAYYPPVDSHGASTVGLNFADRDYYQEAKASLKPYISNLFMGRASVPFPLVAMSVPIVIDGKFRGVAVGGLDLNYINGLLKLSTRGEAIKHATIIDRKGQVVASTHRLEPMQHFNQSHREGIDLLKINIFPWQKGFQHFNSIEGYSGDVYIRETNIDTNQGWNLITEVPVEPYQRMLQTLYTRNLAIVLGLVLVTLTIASRVSRMITKPMSQLATVTTDLPGKLLAQENLEWPNSNYAEIDSLVGNFKSMASTLRHNFVDIEKALHRSDEEAAKLEAIIAGIGDGVSIQDPDYRVLYQNQVQIDLVGERLGELCYKAYERREQVCEGCPVQASFADGRVHTVERCAVTDNGNIPVEITASPLKDSEGNIISVIEVVRNITDRKKAEEMLQLQKDKLREQLSYESALNKMAEIIVVNEETDTILQSMAEIIGETLEVDRTLIFYVDIHSGKAVSLCRWLNPEITDNAPMVETFALNMFAETHKHLMEKRHCLQSHHDAANPLFIKDGADRIVHGNMKILSLFWHPFAFDDDGYYLLVFNQVKHRRDWRKEEIDFIKAVGKQVEIAIQKISFLERRKLAEQEIWEEKERAQVTLHSIGDAVITANSKGEVEYLNPVAEDLTGWRKEEACGQPLTRVFNIINENTGKPAENPVETCLREGRIVGLANHTVLIHKDGHKFAIEDSAAPIKNRSGDVIGVILVFHDVSEKRNLLQQMIHQAYHDPLTDLPNRILFNDRLSLATAQAYRNKSMLAVLFLDLDRFKLVNDMLGHAMGDWLLKEVAERLVKTVRECDTIARLGGDEFTVLIPQLEHEQHAARIAEKILHAFQPVFIVGGHEFQITASIGVALYPNDGEDPETLMKHADTAMYRAKEQGRNNYQLFTPSMNARILERLALENNLRHALERDEFAVYYQPQINIETGKVTGAEALVRWNHPEKGIVSPAEFIPLAEDTGLIVPLGEWVLRMACAQNKAWQREGYPPMRVTVNLSACQFQQGNLVETIAAILDETGLDPQWLELEITESVIMQDVEYTIKTLHELRDMGINIAIDDFGKGYSSLNYLKRFPIHTLKIDRSFVGDITANCQDAAIVTTIIVLAQNLNLKVIAEGVENEAQLDFLKQRRCVEMQGYFFSKPVPAAEFEKLLEQAYM